MTGREPFDGLYSRKVLQLAAAISRVGRLERPDASADAASRLCGSRITVDLKLTDGRISDYAHDIEACALGQTAASVVAREIVGATPEELRALREQMLAMLKHGGPPPAGKWADLALLKDVKDYPARHGSVMLVFDAVVRALDSLEGAETGRLAEGRPHV